MIESNMVVVVDLDAQAVLTEPEPDFTYGVCLACGTRVATHMEPLGLTCRQCCVCSMIGTRNVDAAIVIQQTSTTVIVSLDAPMCRVCGTLMVRTGACHTCPDCGESGGCG